MAKGIAAHTDFDPSEYRVVGYYYNGPSSDMQVAYTYDHKALIEAVGEEEAERLANIGQCQSCGTYFNHGAVVRYLPTSSYLAIGQICAAEYFSFSTVYQLRQTEARKARERRERAERIKAEAEEQLAATPGLAEALDTDHYISADLKAKLFLYGSLSDRQVELAFKLQKDVAEQAEREADEATGQVPVVEGTQAVTGTVLHTRYQDSDFGTVFKMLVEVDAGDGKTYKVWGTVPAAIDHVDKGDKVTFTAAFERSRDDEFFGFYKRPRKAELLEHQINPSDCYIVSTNYDDDLLYNVVERGRVVATFHSEAEADAFIEGLALVE